MTALKIFAATGFIFALIGFFLGLILPTVKKALINISALTLILTVIFINLVRDVTKAIKYITIG